MNFGSDLSYIALVVDDVDAATRMWSGPFGLTPSQLELPGRDEPVSLMEVGETALALLPVGDPLAGGQQHTGVHHVALGVPDVREAAELARDAGVPGEDGADLDAAGRYLLSRQATGGIRTYLVERRDRGGFEPGFLRRVDHIGIMGTDNQQARDVYCDRLGCVLTGEQVDTEIRTSTEHFVYTANGTVHTVVYNRPAEFVASVHDLFIRVGDCDLEIIESLDPHDQADAGPPLPGTGTLKLDHSAVTGFIAKRGPGLHHVAFRVDDIDASLARLADQGLDLIDRQGRPGARGSRIGFVRLRSTQGVLVHLVERDDDLGAPRQVLAGTTAA
jgi:catechol 2,3-dioxygenase-like lactoylglutathione lyase family enzyme